jgi:ubiquinone/menaquinone biosynthesis C-methylase UbiE
LKEIYRVLKQNGEVEISTPNPLHYRTFLRLLRGKSIILTENSDHIATWTEAELGNILRIAGFRNVRFKYVLLEATVVVDKKHMIYDRSLFNALPNFMRGVTGRNIIAYARKLPYS